MNEILAKPIVTIQMNVVEHNFPVGVACYAVSKVDRTFFETVIDYFVTVLQVKAI